MNRIELLSEKVQALYEAQYEGRDDWADWMYINHVRVVAQFGAELADRFGANKDIVVAACLVHDIGDTVTSRNNEGHEERSLEIASTLLTETGFTEDEKNIILGEILPNHSCREGQTMQSLEGKVMATADSLAHFNTDFYLVATRKFAERGETLEDTKNWALKKIEKDFHRKIFFDEVREEVRENYETIKKFFSLTQPSLD